MIELHLTILSRSESNAPRPNKRFLSSIIRSTDDHNKTILRAQALAAQEVKREKEEAERRDRRARAEEAVAAERDRRSGGSSSSRRRVNDTESWDRWDGRNDDRKRKKRSWDGASDEEEGDYDRDRDGRRRRHRSRSRSRTRDEHRSSRHSRHGQSSSTRQRRHRSRSRSPLSARGYSDDKEGRRGDKRSMQSHRTEEGKHNLRRSRSRSVSPISSQNGDTRRSRRKGHNSRERHHRSSRRRTSASPIRHSPLSSTEQTEDSGLSKRRRSRSPTPVSEYGSDRSAKRHRSSRTARARSTSSSRSNEDHDREAELRNKLAARSKAVLAAGPSKSSRTTSRIPSPKTESRVVESSSHTPRSSTMSVSRSPSPGPEPLVQLPSKMDRYFEESYDPRLDVAPLTAPKVPATGLINNAEFEGWDAMLELMRQRREDKDEKKRLQRMGLDKEEIKKAMTTGTLSNTGANERWSAQGVSIMDIEYKKRGSVREWDMGKEGF